RHVQVQIAESCGAIHLDWTNRGSDQDVARKREHFVLLEEVGLVVENLGIVSNLGLEPANSSHAAKGDAKSRLRAAAGRRRAEGRADKRVDEYFCRSVACQAQQQKSGSQNRESSHQVRLLKGHGWCPVRVGR